MTLLQPPRAKPIRVAKSKPPIPAVVPAVVPAVPSTWVMVQLTGIGERCHSWQQLIQEIKRNVGQDVRVFYPGLWLEDDFSDRAELIDGYLFVEHHEQSTYDALKDPHQQRMVYFKGVVEESSGRPAFITEQQVQKMVQDVKRKLNPVLIPGTYAVVERGDWRKCRVFIEAVVRVGLVICQVRTAERVKKLLLPINSFARAPELGSER